MNDSGSQTEICWQKDGIYIQVYIPKLKVKVVASYIYYMHAIVDLLESSAHCTYMWYI